MSKAAKALAVILLAPLAGAVAPVGAQAPIRIGATLSQTGALATTAQAILRGYQLCVKHTNDKGGVLGRKLELVVHDDASDPATAVRLYQQLIAQDKADLVLGPMTAPITDAVADVTEKHKVPMVAPAAGTTSVYRKGRKFIFSLNPRKEFPGQFPPAHGYGACQVLVEAVRRAGSLDGAKVRDVISKMDYHTVYGRFRVDRDGVQIGHKMLLVQVQDGKGAIVWPEELAPDKPRFPTPPWNQRP